MKKVIISMLVILMSMSLLFAGCKASKPGSTLPQDSQSTEGTEQTGGTESVDGTEGGVDSPIGDAELDIDVFEGEENSGNGGQSGNNQGNTGNNQGNTGNNQGNTGNNQGNSNDSPVQGGKDEPSYETPLDKVEDPTQGGSEGTEPEGSEPEGTEPEGTEHEQEETPKPTNPKRPVNENGGIELPKIPG